MLPKVTVAAVISTVAGEQTGAGSVIVSVGSAFINTVVVVVLLQVPLVNVYVIYTVYGVALGVLVARLISPVAALRERPAGAEV